MAGPVSAMVSGARRLASRLDALFALGASSHGALFDRQNMGAPDDRIIIGPPGRSEFNRVAQNAREVINLATYGYLALGGNTQVKQAAKDAIDRYGTHTGG